MSEPERHLHPAIEVDPSVDDVDAVWERFEIFEALHHRQTICNPMTSVELDQALDALDLSDGDVVLDVACGSGELLMRAAERVRVDGIGLDLSPWMLCAAASRAETRVPDASLRWVLTEARDWMPPAPVDVVTCLGADWIWHGSPGTLAALAARVRPGGCVAIGTPRLHFDADPEAVSRQFGRMETVQDIDELIVGAGLRTRARIDPDDAGWDSYMDRTEADARAWAECYPGARSERWVQEQQGWREARERDRSIIGWSVWIAERLEKAA